MAEQGTYEGYKLWDEERRERFPLATHWIYQSRVGDFKLAEWCPLTGIGRFAATGHA